MWWLATFKYSGFIRTFPHVLTIPNIATSQRSISQTFFERGPFLCLKNNHGSSQPCHVHITRYSKLKLYIPNACYHSVQNLLSSRLLSKNLKINIYRTVILPVVLYGCETWSLTLREERKLRVFENRVLRRIFGPRRDEVTGEWRRLHNEELNDLYSSPNIVRVIK